MKKKTRKRTRLIALLAALAALLAGGIGTGAAFAAMAAVRSASSAKAKALRPEIKAFGAPAGPVKESVLKGSSHKQQENVFSSSQAYSTFLSSIVPQNQYNLGGSSLVKWAGQQVTGKIEIGQGTDFPIAYPIGFWNGSSLVNPNSLTPGQIEEAMMNGDYMGNVGAAVNEAGSAGETVSFLGEVNYEGIPNTSMQNFINGGSDWWIGSSDLSPSSILYDFQTQCISNNMLSNPYFSNMASLPKSELQSLIQGLVFGDGQNGQPLGLYTSDAMFYDQIPDAGVEKDLASLKQDGNQLIGDIGSYQSAMKAWKDAGGSQNPSAAKSAYENALGSAKSTQPLLCLAVFNQNVGYSSIPKNEALYVLGSANPPSMPYGTYSAWGWGPSYVGSSDAADSTLEMNLSSTATDFLYSVLASQNYNYNPNTSGIFLQAMYVANENSPSLVFSKDGSASTVTVTWNGNEIKSSIVLRSLGFAGQANPTSLPSGVSLTPSSPASYGLWFKAYDQEGDPLKSAKIELSLQSGNSQSPSAVFGDYLAFTSSSAPQGVGSQEWPNIGKEFWYTNIDSSPMPFVISSLSSDPGYFDLSGIPNGVYQVKILSGTTESGQQVSYGSYYSAPTFEVNLDAGANNGIFTSSYSAPETMSAVSDPCGFVDPSQDEVVVGASEPASAAVEGSSLSTSPVSATVGSSNPFTFQATSYLPFDLSGQRDSSGASASSSPLSFRLSLPQGEVVEEGSVQVNGLSLQSLGINPSYSSGLSFSLSPYQISQIEANGYLPAPNQGAKLSSARSLGIEWKAYLSSNFVPPSSPGTFEFSYSAYSASDPSQGAKELSPSVETNGPANNSVPSSLTTTESSSSTGLWFKDLNADGSASTGAKFLVQNSSSKYLVEDFSSGSFEGWSWTSSPQDATEFSQRNTDAVFSFGGLQNGTYTVTQIAWPSSMGKSASQENTGAQNWPGVSPDLPAGGPDWAGYPGHLGGKAGYEGSFKVSLSYSSPEAMSASADPAGLVDTSEDQIYALSPIKMAPLIGSALSSDAYQTETVGIPFEEGWEGYLPMAVTSPTSTAGQNGYASSLQVSIDENVNGLKMSDPSTSNIEVAGIPLSTLVSNGASATSASSPASSSVTVYTITLPYKALEYLEENGKNAEGQSLSSSSNRLIIISFPAVMETSFKNGGTFRQWMALGSGWWNQDAGSGWFVSSSPLYTNGPADNSVPSSLSPSLPSSSTGIWFKSLWFDTSTPATGSVYTLQNSSKEYLAPVESNGTFEGWKWQAKPYDFSERNDGAVFSFGGLADGTYTLTRVVSPPKATPSSLVFSSTLSYSSPQALASVKDPLSLLVPSKDTVWAVVVPSHLPFTGGKWILSLSLSSVLLIGAGAVLFLVIKKRRKRA